MKEAEKLPEDIFNDLRKPIKLIIKLFIIYLILIVAYWSLLGITDRLFFEGIKTTLEEWSRNHKDSLITIFFVCVLVHFIYFSAIVSLGKLSEFLTKKPETSYFNDKIAKDLPKANLMEVGEKKTLGSLHEGERRPVSEGNSLTQYKQEVKQ